MMIARDISFDSPERNIIFDNVLLQKAEEQFACEYLRFWESPSVFIVLGRIGKASEELKINAVTQAGVPVLRRSSGGGTVVQGPGCLNYTLILKKNRDPALGDIRRSYEYILTKVSNALRLAGVDSKAFPVSDVALENGCKISGNAQKRGRHYILHHGTFLCHFDLSLIEQYLLMPKDMPEYRRERKHLDFVANINISPNDIKKNLINIFNCVRNEDEISEDEQCYIEEMRGQKKVSVKISETDILRNNISL